MKKIFKDNKKYIFELYEVIILIIVSVILTAIITGYTIFYINNKNNSNFLFKDVLKTFNKIKSNYFIDVDESDLADSAIDGMMSYLNEKYSEYLNNEDATILNERLNGTYHGIGVVLRLSGDVITIDNVITDSPAFDAGIKKGDIVLKIDDKEIDFNSISEFINEDTKYIKLTIKRDEQIKEFNINIKELNTPVTSTEIFEVNNKNIGYLSLTCFSSDAYNQVVNDLKLLESNNIDSLIIDLRDNSGGYLEQAEKISSLFLKKGSVIYYLENKSGIKKVYDKTSVERKYMIIVLINEHTASASEILASALKESYGAIIVGTTSYGKGKVQETATVNEDKMVKYTTAKWLTPNGNWIDGNGITPDIYIELNASYYINPTYENDNQLMSVLDIFND